MLLSRVGIHSPLIFTLSTFLVLKLIIMACFCYTGNNGTIDGQGSIWWNQINNHSLNYSRPHIVEFTWSDNIVVSNLTFLNAPAWNIHPVYCRQHLLKFSSEFLFFSLLLLLLLLLFLEKYINVTPFGLMFRCSKLLVQNITAYSPPDSPYTSGVVPGMSKFLNCSFQQVFEMNPNHLSNIQKYITIRCAYL